jgi:small-conductance mechanosensitive channel
MEKVRKIIHDTVREVEGVLPHKPVSVYYLRYDDAARIIRVYWYVDSIDKKEPVQDQVNSAIERALLEGGIEIPFPTYNLLLKQQLANKREEE